MQKKKEKVDVVKSFQQGFARKVRRPLKIEDLSRVMRYRALRLCGVDLEPVIVLDKLPEGGWTRNNFVELMFQCRIESLTGLLERSYGWSPQETAETAKFNMEASVCKKLIAVHELLDTRQKFADLGVHSFDIPVL